MWIACQIITKNKKMINQNIIDKAQTLGIGASGTTLLEVVNTMPDISTIETIVKLTMQVIIGITTIWYMIKKPKKQ